VIDSAVDSRLGGESTLAALQRAVQAYPDRVFLDCAGELFTYGRTDQLVTRLAHALADLGVGRGDTVLTQLDNTADPILLWLAANTLGAIWVPVNTAYQGEYLRHQLIDSHPVLAVCETQYLDAMLEAAQDTGVTRILVRGNRPSLPPSAIPLGRLDDHRGTNDTRIVVSGRPSDLSCLIYTSGTTGPSKGCMISFNYLCNQGRQLNEVTSTRPDDVNWTCLPLFHMTALSLVTATLLVQGRVAIEARFSVTRFWSEIRRSGATSAVLMATIFPWVAHAPDTPDMHACVGQLRTVTGVPVSAAVRAIWEKRFGVSYVNSFVYGQTEASVLAYARQSDVAPTNSCGRIAGQDFEVRIVDDEDQPVPEGAIGEIVFRPVRPDIMFSGYWRRPEDTVGVWRNLWMHTGDLGRVENGFLFFVDRKKDYLRVRGENISSFEVERTFLNHQAVSEAAVHAVSAGVAEDSVKVTLTLKPGEAATPDELCSWSIEYLPHFAVPRYFEIRQELPRTPNNRVMKFQLRDEGITPATWDRHAAGIAVRRR
jgi:carnitine-CoA ligase